MSKIDCGALAEVGKDGVEFRGPVRLGNRLDGELTLRKHRRSGSPGDKPDFCVEYIPRIGDPRPIGAGWIKGGIRVRDFISMTLDDPDWPSPVYLQAFPPVRERGETAWTIVWTRPRGARVQNEAPTSQGEG